MDKMISKKIGQDDVVHVEYPSIGPEEDADQAEHIHREEMQQEPKIGQAEQACMEEMRRMSIAQTDPVTETELRRIPTYVNHAESQRKAAETKPRSNTNSANRAEHQSMAVEQDEPICEADQVEQISGPENGPGMTKKSSHRVQIGCEGARREHVGSEGANSQVQL